MQREDKVESYVIENIIKLNKGRKGKPVVDDNGVELEGTLVLSDDGTIMAMKVNSNPGSDVELVRFLPILNVRQSTTFKASELKLLVNLL